MQRSTYKGPASSPGTVTPGAVDRLLPPLAQVIPISELRIGLTVKELSASDIVHSATDDVVPSAVVTAEQLVEVLVLENVRIAESRHI